ncbi:MAG: Hsp70 family protein [Parachlamydia sp.]|jgi:molecular chaperone DnaK (HSP70)|nr:Hsp70 family protein [Parachlamydia sp.]
MSAPEYIIGIDLGTTNCTLAYLKKGDEDETPSIHQDEIIQVTSTNTQGSPLSLPSFIYYLLPEEFQANAAALQWEDERNFTIGTFARDRGGEIPARLISSAKSWLCHAGIDRREAVLPHHSEEVENKLSPLDACAEFLSHLKQAWNHQHPDALFNQQTVLVTVPASFDPSARQLVQEAAEKAGYPSIILLEEPQAAFYAWLHKHAQNWREMLEVGASVLVIDIGGGTTDFSLIGVEEEKGNLILKRLAVGSHLLLGGDNIDLALAYLAKNKLEEEGHAVDEWQLQTLVHQCRLAKEQLFGSHPPEQVDLAILGRGSRLIGNTLKTHLTKKEADQLILDGFFPLVNPNEQSNSEIRSGIQQIGLPFAQDPRISCQLAKFLSQSDESDKIALPTAVLFNGGTLKAKAFRSQIMQLLNQWAKKMKKPPIQELAGPDLDFAVSRGAAYYGLAREGKAIRIKSGTSRSYYIGVEEAMPAVPGISPPMRAVCVVPFGMEEGEERELDGQEFSLLLGEQASFRFFSHGTPHLANGTQPAVGMVVKNWKQELTELHPVETLLDKKEGEGKTTRVKLKSKVTELGVLELWCEASNERKWKLEFDIRK